MGPAPGMRVGHGCPGSIGTFSSVADASFQIFRDSFQTIPELRDYLLLTPNCKNIPRRIVFALMDLPAHGHEPVLVDHVLQLLAPRQGQTFVDCTVGRAGHALRIAERIGANGILIGIDADPKNLEYAQSRLA